MLTAKPKTKAVEVLECFDGELWVTGGHYSVDEIKNMEDVMADSNVVGFVKFKKKPLVAVKHLWFYRGLVYNPYEGEASNGWGFICWGKEKPTNYKRAYPATELIFS